MNRKTGFTLVELLVVISIIGLLSSVVFASLTSAKGRARKAAAQATLRGVMPELVVCADDTGTARSAGSAPTTALFVCGTDGNGTTGYAGHTVKWPVLPAGWSYRNVSGALSSGDFSYSAQGDSVTVTCNQATGACN